MVQFNAPNFLTVGLISVGFVIGLKYGLGLLGIAPRWL
jgi:hypothetical protein